MTNELMNSDRWWPVVRGMAMMVVAVVLVSLPCSAYSVPWRIYAFREDEGSFYPLASPLASHVARLTGQPSSQPFNHPIIHPPTWHIAASAFADVTGDGTAEWVLLVWRPWRDWPIQRWSPAPSPIAGFHDAAGDSCHLILLDPHDGREIWAGSALPAPLLALAVEDVDGDGCDEVVTLEGDYATGREGPAAHVDVWRWNGFGFTLEWRSPPGVFYRLRLTDADNSGILDIAVRGADAVR